MLRAALIAALVAACAAQDHPHLSQAWQANSVGDGEPGVTGLESYIFEGCGHSPQPPTSETCMHAHKWDTATVLVWVDYVSIPQKNHRERALAIASLPTFASVSDYFIVTGTAVLMLVQDLRA